MGQVKFTRKSFIPGHAFIFGRQISRSPTKSNRDRYCHLLAAIPSLKPPPYVSLLFILLQATTHRLANDHSFTVKAHFWLLSNPIRASATCMLVLESPVMHEEIHLYCSDENIARVLSFWNNDHMPGCSAFLSRPPTYDWLVFNLFRATAAWLIALHLF